MTLCLTPRSPTPESPSNAGATRMGHAKCAPSADLAAFVDYYWISRWDRRGVAARAASALLDPCMHIHVQDGRAEVMGVVRGAFRVQIADEGCIVGVRFRPGGFFPFVQRSVAEWTDRAVPVDDVFAPLHMPSSRARSAERWARELSDEVSGCEGDAAGTTRIIAERLDSFLLLRLPQRDASAEHAGALVALIAARPDVRRMSDLVTASGRSERTLHRLFARYIGVSPAWVVRHYRLKSAAARLTARPPADVRDVASDLGYADQAHFIRDFRATIGVTPGAYVNACARPLLARREIAPPSQRDAP